MDKTKVSDRETLRNIICQWNANRLDLFEISEPNEVRVLCCRAPTTLFFPELPLNDNTYCHNT